MLFSAMYEQAYFVIWVEDWKDAPNMTHAELAEFTKDYHDAYQWRSGVFEEASTQERYEEMPYQVVEEKVGYFI